MAALREAAGQTDDAIAAWYAIATFGDGGGAPVPDAERDWRDLWAQAMEAKLGESISEEKREALIAHAKSYTWEQTAEAARRAVNFINMV